ncbi:ABC transporter substrate-binding protein [Sediminibacterium soli]|uniref:ABC transporter substrate-binding protein n=1 Tax=Sediminibacterium soli TaxID=2698829 RepID=UPI00137AE920|nr:ABC transporter substrate-binding protein [Sediminibacterium soli]NCI48121.1 amino acid ABC transporter substrate-binding protein [Sediminibacterium soli]
MRLNGLLVMLVLAFSVPAFAQGDSSRPLRVAVFAPVYLDSAFNGYDYKLGNANLPKYMLPGLDFYHGVMMAIDSLNTEKTDLEISVYDSKSREASASWLNTDPDLAGVSLIIAAFNTRSEVKPLADYALAHKIPLISATYPNDAGVIANPYFIMLNPRISSHIDAIHKYLQRNFPTDNILLFRKKGSLEDLILYLLTDLNRKTAGTPVKLKPVLLSDTASATTIARHLDSTRQNIVLCGTLNETFGMNLARGIADANLPATVIGMPTWDGFAGIGKAIDMIYSTPYNLTRTDKLSRDLDARYRARYGSRPGDMFYKGFESLYHFTRLAVKYPDNLMAHISDYEFKLFNEFDIQPVKAKTDSQVTDFLENKKIYFIRKTDNKLRSVD